MKNNRSFQAAYTPIEEDQAKCRELSFPPAEVKRNGQSIKRLDGDLLER